MRIGIGLVLAALSGAALVGVQGCAVDAQEVTEVGQLKMALTATSTLGDLYRLVGAQFEIVNPNEEVTTFDAAPFDNEEFATVDLSVGPHTIRLLNGWTLEKLVNGAYEPVDAGRAGPSTISFMVEEGETTEVSYSFRTASDEVTFGMGELAIGISVQEIPTAWTCELGYYAALDGCDCACGVPDPDCEDPTQTRVWGCEGDQTCTDWGTCEGSYCGDGFVDEDEACDDGNEVAGDGCRANCTIEVPVPGGWTCDANFYAAADGCDCACGAPDPDCEDPAQQVWGCDEGQICTPAGTCSF